MTSAPPYIRQKDSCRTLTEDVIIVLFAVYFMAVYYYGARAAVLGLFAAGVAFLCDVVCKLLLRQHITLREHSSLVTALMIPLLLPASIPYSVVAAAVVFALVVMKYPFGGVGGNLFNPAAGGFAFAVICFPRDVFAYPTPLERLDIFGPYTGRSVASAAYTLKAGGIPSVGDFVEMLLGNVPGPMGAANILVVCACLLYLVIRGTARWQGPVFFLATCAGLAWLFPRASMPGNESVMYELFSGILIFGAVFMLTEPVTSPKRSTGTVLYAVLTGVMTMLFRRFGGFEEGFPFALLLCNAFVPLFDHADELLHRRIRRAKLVSSEDEKTS